MGKHTWYLYSTESDRYHHLDTHLQNGVQQIKVNPTMRAETCVKHMVR